MLEYNASSAEKPPRTVGSVIMGVVLCQDIPDSPIRLYTVVKLTSMVVSHSKMRQMQKILWPGAQILMTKALKEITASAAMR